MSSETYYVDELLKAEEEANRIIKNAEKERYVRYPVMNLGTWVHDDIISMLNLTQDWLIF